MTDHDLLSDMDKRLAVVELQVEGIRGMKRILWGNMITIIAAVIGFAYGYGQLITTVESFDNGELKRNVATALTVLGDHGTEFANIQSELSRLRGVDDAFHNEISQVNQRMDVRTSDRFYKHDGDRLEARIQRLENRVYKLND